MYKTWTDIVDERNKNGYSSTSQQLKVHPSQVDDKTEYIFNLLPAPHSEKKYDGSSLPNSEDNRRSKLKNLKIYARLLINNQKVSETKP